MIMAAALVATSLMLPATVHADSTVTVKVTVPKHVRVATVDADTIAVQSNTDWRLVLDTADGFVEIVGQKTGGTPAQVDLPDNAVSWWVVTN
jgi:hypothetical protein